MSKVLIFLFACLLICCCLIVVGIGGSSVLLIQSGVDAANKISKDIICSIASVENKNDLQKVVRNISYVTYASEEQFNYDVEALTPISVVLRSMFKGKNCINEFPEFGLSDIFSGRLSIASQFNVDANNVSEVSGSNSVESFEIIINEKGKASIILQTVKDNSGKFKLYNIRLDNIDDKFIGTYDPLM